MLLRGTAIERRTAVASFVVLTVDEMQKEVDALYCSVRKRYQKKQATKIVKRRKRKSVFGEVEVWAHFKISSGVHST